MSHPATLEFLLAHDLREVADNVLAEFEQFFVAFNAQKSGLFCPLARRKVQAASRLVEDGERRFAGKS